MDLPLVPFNSLGQIQVVDLSNMLYSNLPKHVTQFKLVNSVDVQKLHAAWQVPFHADHPYFAPPSHEELDLLMSFMGKYPETNFWVAFLAAREQVLIVSQIPTCIPPLAINREKHFEGVRLYYDMERMRRRAAPLTRMNGVVFPGIGINYCLANADPNTFDTAVKLMEEFTATWRYPLNCDSVQWRLKMPDYSSTRESVTLQIENTINSIRFLHSSIPPAVYFPRPPINQVVQAAPATPILQCSVVQQSDQANNGIINVWEKAIKFEIKTEPEDYEEAQPSSFQSPNQLIQFMQHPRSPSPQPKTVEEILSDLESSPKTFRNANLKAVLLDLHEEVYRAKHKIAGHVARRCVNARDKTKAPQVYKTRAIECMTDYLHRFYPYSDAVHGNLRIISTNPSFKVEDLVEVPPLPEYPVINETRNDRAGTITYSLALPSPSIELQRQEELSDESLGCKTYQFVIPVDDYDPPRLTFFPHGSNAWSDE